LASINNLLSCLFPFALALALIAMAAFALVMLAAVALLVLSTLALLLLSTLVLIGLTLLLLAALALLVLGPRADRLAAGCPCPARHLCFDPADRPYFVR
jgi:hypothetical protein